MKRSCSVEILSPASGAALTSPLATLRVRYENARARTAILEVGKVKHIVELPDASGEIRENITLLVGKNKITASVGRAKDEVVVQLKRSKQIVIKSPAPKKKAKTVSRTTRATEVSGTFSDVSCPAGVIAVNGFMQQFAIQGKRGTFAEMVVLRPGDNHLAVQIGEHYATQLVKGKFSPAKILVTLVWDTCGTDVDLYVKEPGGGSVWYSNKSLAGGGNLDVDRTRGFGPENYSLGKAGGEVKPGAYEVRAHYYADGGIGRTEWTTRVITDEATPAQQRRSYYGILDRARSDNDQPGGRGGDWDDVCTITVTPAGEVTLDPEA